MSTLVRIADRVLNRPLMIMPEKLAIIAQVLEGRIGIDASDLVPEASRFVGSNVAADGSKKPYRVENGVAIIPVMGSLVNRGAFINSMSGMTSYEGLAFQLEQAASDSDVKSILLDMDSPGGEAVGAFEAADKVRSVGKSKRVVAMVNGMAASAAYAIASAASEIIATPSAVAGSIGVVLMHADYSVALHQQGVKPTLIHAGAHKVDGNPYQPLTENVRADLQAEVDQLYGMFVSSVAQGRKGRMTEKSIRSTEARTYIGQAALDAGLVDGIGGFQSVLADLSKSGTARNSNPKRTKMTEPETLSVNMISLADHTAAVNAARTEATAGHEAALATARAEGAKAERERINAIINSEEAKGREKGALHLALSTSLSLDDSKSALSGFAKESAPAAAAHGLFLQEEAAPAPKKAKVDTNSIYATRAQAMQAR